MKNKWSDVIHIRSTDRIICNSDVVGSGGSGKGGGR